MSSSSFSDETMRTTMKMKARMAIPSPTLRLKPGVCCMRATRLIMGLQISTGVSEILGQYCEDNIRAITYLMPILSRIVCLPYLLSSASFIKISTFRCDPF